MVGPKLYIIQAEDQPEKIINLLLEEKNGGNLEFINHMVEMIENGIERI